VFELLLQQRTTADTTNHSRMSKTRGVQEYMCSCHSRPARAAIACMQSTARVQL
jgi:hypothetical protein